MALQVGELYASFGIDTSGVDKALANIEKKFSSMGRSLAISGTAMTAAVTTPLVKIGKDIFKTGTDFGQAMSRVFATAGLDKAIATDVQAMEALRAKALEMGSTTKFTSSEAAEGLNYMAMAGWETQQMLDGLPAIMNLAAASGEDLGSVSDIVTDALTAFGLKAKDAEHFADVLAKASSSANTNVGLMGNTFKYVAPLAGAMGYSIDDMAVAIGLMANAGIKGEMAGTQLRNVITGLVKPTKEQAKAMKKYGVSLKRQDGTMKSFAEVVDNLRTSMSGLDEEEKAMVASIFGGARGMSGLLAIANATAEDVDKLTESIQNCSGAAENMAKTALDNAAGDIVYFKSAVDGAKISLWNLVEGPFRSIVQQATSYVSAFSAMDDATKKGVLRTAAFTAAIGPATAAMGGLVAAVPKLAKGLKLMFSPLGMVGIGLLALGAAAMDTENSIGKTLESISKTVGEKAGQIADYVALNQDELVKNAGQFLESLKTSLDNALPNLLQAGYDILVAINDGIALNIDSIIEIGKTIIDNVADAIENNASRIVPSGLQLLRNIIVGMIESVPDVVEDIGRAAIAIGDELINYDWEETGKGIWTAIQNALTATKDTLENLGNMIKEKFGVDSWDEVAGKILEGLWTAITGATSWVARIATSIINGIANSSVFSNAGLSFALIANKIVTGIADYIPKLFSDAQGLLKAGINLGSAILGGINTALQQMKVDDLGTKLGDAAKAIVKGILTTVKIAGDSEEMQAFMENLKEGMIAAGSLLGDVAGELVKYIFSKEGVTDIFNAGKTILRILCDGLQAALLGISSFVGNFVDTLLISLGLVDPAEREAFKRSGELLAAQIYAGLAEGVEAGSADYTKSAALAATAWLNGVVTDIDDSDFIEFANRFREALVGTAEDSVEAFRDNVIYYMEHSGMSGNIDFSGITDDLWQALYDASKSKDWTSLMDFVNIGAEDLFNTENLSSDASAYADAQQEAINKYVAPQTQKAFSEAANSAATEGTKALELGILEGQGPVSEAAKTVSSAAVNEFVLCMSEEEGTNVANTFTGAIVAALNASKVTITQTANLTAAAVKNAFSNILTSSAGSTIGYQFGQGMANGIGSAGGMIKDAAAKIGQDAIEALRQAIDSHSPSHITEDIGEDFDEGYYIGIRNNTMRAIRAASDMGKASADALAARGYGTKSHSRNIITSGSISASKKAAEAASKATDAMNNLANSVSKEASYTPRSSGASYTNKQSGYDAAPASSSAASGRSGMGISGDDLGALIETYARLVATALNGVTVEMNDVEVGTVVAPVVSEIIAQNAMARRNGTT